RAEACRPASTWTAAPGKYATLLVQSLPRRPYEFPRQATSSRDIFLGCALTKPERPKCHGIAQHVHGADAGLPFITHRPVQEVNGSRFNARPAPLPTLSRLPTKAQRARSEEGQSNDVFVRGAIAVPPDTSALWILRHHDLLERVS